MEDVYIRLTKLPPSVGGYVVQDPAGNYNIYLNKNHSWEHNTKALKHELRHIDGNHFSKTEHVTNLEIG